MKGHLFKRYKTSEVASLMTMFMVMGLATLPLWSQTGIINTRGGGDSPFLLQRTHQLVTALQDGHFPVRWMPDANYGYGYPFFNFYAPLSIYMAGTFRLIGFSYSTAIQLAQVSGFLVAGWGMFRLGYGWFGRRDAGILVAAAYTVAPFHLVNIYVRGDSLAEFWAMAFYPLCLLAVDSIWQKRTGVLWLGVSYAGLILSHNISALIFSPFLLLYIMVRAWQVGKTDAFSWAQIKLWLARLWFPLVGIVLGLGLSAWFWLPAMAERHLVQLDPVTTGYFHYSNHFRGADLIQHDWLFNYDVANGEAFRMGWGQAVAILLGLGAWLWGSRLPSQKRLLGLYAILAFAIATFMILPASAPLWQHLPLLPFTQFPWRFLSVQALAGALLTAGIFYLPLRPWGQIDPRTLLAVVVGLFLLITNLGALRVDSFPVTDQDVTAERLAEYEWFTGNIGTTVSAEYLPAMVQPRPYTSAWLHEGIRWQARVQTGDAALQLVQAQTDEQVWTANVLSEEAIVHLPTLYWGGWQAKLDGKDWAVQGAEGSGLISLVLPQGEHELVLTLGRTIPQTMAELISVLTLLCMLVLWIQQAYVPANTRLYRYLAFTLVALLIVMVVANFQRTEETQRTGLYTWDFAQLGYLHRSDAGIPFTNGSHLQDIALSQDTISAGETLAITLDWQGDIEQVVTLSLTTPADLRYEMVPAIATASTILTSGQMTLSLPIPAHAPAGLYMPKLTVTDAQALTPQGWVRGDLYFQPVRVVAVPDLVGIPRQDLEARLVQVDVTDNLLNVQLAWWTAYPLIRDLQLSLRLSNEAGVRLAQLDAPTGYGYQPSTLWQPQEWTQDWWQLPLTTALPQYETLALTVNLYSVEDNQPYLTRRLGTLRDEGAGFLFTPNTPQFVLTEPIEPLLANFNDEVTLLGYRITETDAGIDLTLYWQAQRADLPNYHHFVHLFDVETEAIVAQHDTMPQVNSYPMPQWTAEEIVADHLTLPFAEVPTGVYHLAVGLFENDGALYPRVLVWDEEGEILPANRVILPIIIEF